MGQATVYCELCGEMIPEQDFAKGKAVHHEGKNYCQKCRAQVAHLLPAQDGTPGSGVPRTSSGSGVYRAGGSTPVPGVRRVSGVFQPAAAGKAASSSGTSRRGSSSGIRKAVTAQVVKPATPAHGHRAVHAQEGRATDTRSKRKQKSANLALILSVIGGVLVLGVIVVFLVRSSNKAKAELEKQRHLKQAEAAMTEVRGLAEGTPQDLEDKLTAITKTRDKVRGYRNLEDELDRIVAEVKAQQSRARVNDQVEQELREIDEAADKDRPNFQKYQDQLAAIQKRNPPAEFEQRIAELRKTVLRKGIQAHVDDARKLVYSPNPAYRSAIDQLTRLLDRCGQTAELLQTVQGEIDTIKKVREVAALAAFKKLEEDAKFLVSVGKFDEALKVCEGYSEEFADTKWQIKVVERESWVKERRRSYKGAGNEKGGHLDSGNEGEMLGEAPTAGEEIPLFSGEDLRHWILLQHTASNGSWDAKPEERCLSGVNTQPLPHTNDKLLVIYRGEIRTDFDLTFEARVNKGEGFVVLARLSPKGCDAVSFTMREPGKWMKWTVQFRGKVASTKTEKGTQSRINLAGEAPSGKIGFALEAGQAADFRDISIRVVEK